jgi:hypothetical protein
MKVLVNDGKGGRKVIEARLIKENKSTVKVALPDGSIITRNKSRDIPEESK